MYMQDGKPIQPNYGRKNPTISRLEFEQLKQDIAAIRLELDALKLSKGAEVNEPVVDGELDSLKAEALSLGIEVKGTWGANRIKKAIEDVKASKDAV